VRRRALVADPVRSRPRKWSLFLGGIGSRRGGTRQLHAIFMNQADYAEALKWFRLGADQGDARAQLDLGVMYLNGQGVPQNYVQAHMWSNLAASSSTLKKEEHNTAVRNRDLVASKMTPAQIAEAQKRASEWKLKPER
jgi:TPR repeat protein